MTYSKEPAILTDLYGYSGERFGNGIAAGDGFYLTPYKMGMATLWEQYNELRTLPIEDYVRENAPEAAVTGRAGVYAYLYGSGDERRLMIVNPCGLEGGFGGSD